MKKICHITSTPQGFIPRLLRESTTALKIGYKPYIVAQGISFEKDGIIYIGVKPSKNRIERMFQTSKVLIDEGIKIDADIYHLHDPELLLYSSKILNKDKKVIFDSHEFYGIQIQTKEYLPKIFRNRLANIYMKYESYACKKLDAVLAVCTVNGKNYFENRAKSCVLIENLPDLTAFSGMKNFEKKSNIVYVGALSTARGIDNLVKAMETVEAKLVLCGTFSSKNYLEQLKALNSYKKVEYKGLLNREQVVAVLAESKIGLSTLFHSGQYGQIDTLPTKVYEYMALGLPVILSNTSYAKQLIDKYKFGICVNPENVEEIAKAISFLLENALIAAEMGDKGKEIVYNKFNWQIEEKKLINLYERLIN